jgi:hypothetical protein
MNKKALKVTVNNRSGHSESRIYIFLVVLVFVICLSFFRSFLNLWDMGEKIRRPKILNKQQQKDIVLSLIGNALEEGIKLGLKFSLLLDC